MGKLTEEVRSRKAMAEILMPKSYPRVEFGEEQAVIVLKQSIFVVDGYEVMVVLSYGDYEEYRLETLQIHSMQAPFLPFNVVCKLGKAFLGELNLCYTEFFRTGRRIYCWTLKTVDGVAISHGNKPKASNYEGFNFFILNPGTFDLY